MAVSSANVVLTTGSRIGRYEILGEIGAGGMGRVYRARDTQLGRDVALKTLATATGLASDPRRLESEARAIAALNHPHICQIYDVGPDYLVLELVNGRQLQGPLSADLVVRLAVQIASAVSAAHQRGILHRDIKPSNILLTAEGTVKLLDFGLAKIALPEDERSGAATQTAAGTVVGTVAYMSPEQAEGRAVDARSDIFSLGAVLYELLTGRQAFSGASTAAILSAVLRDEPPSIDDVSPAVERVVRRCLAKRSSDRFQTMEELQRELETAATAPVEPAASVAVLPFENLSGDRENEYFGDGLSEEIINALTRVPRLRVIARTSAFAFKGRHEDVRRIADSLGVRHVLEGSVRKSGNRIRVTAQLVAAADGSPLWSDRYDRELADVFAVQDDIAASITRALRVTLSRDSRRRHTPDVASYDHYLKGLHATRTRTPEALAAAHHHFRRAIDGDPHFAVAYAELANVFFQFALYGFQPPRQALPEMQQAARQALAIDPEIPEGHAVMGSATAMFDYNWQDAEREFELALGRTASSPLVHGHYGLHCLLPTGRADRAVQHLTIAVSLDPLNLVVRGELAVCLRAAGRLREANDELRQILRSDPAFPFPYFVLGVNLALEGRIEEALALSERAHAISPWFKPAIGLRAAMLKRTGQVEAAETLRLEICPADAYSDPIGPAIYYLLEGDFEQCADWVERAIDERQLAVVLFLMAHATSLRATPRWPAIARMLKLSDQAR